MAKALGQGLFNDESIIFSDQTIYKYVLRVIRHKTHIFLNPSPFFHCFINFFFIIFRYWKNYVWMPCFVCFDGESNGHFNLFCTYLGKFFYVKSLVACCWPAHTLCLGSFDLRGQLFGVLHQFPQCFKNPEKSNFFPSYFMSTSNKNTYDDLF